MGLSGISKSTVSKLCKDIDERDPQAWLADTLACIPDYKINRVDDLLPWKAAS